MSNEPSTLSSNMKPVNLTNQKNANSREKDDLSHLLLKGEPTLTRPPLPKTPTDGNSSKSPLSKSPLMNQEEFLD